MFWYLVLYSHFSFNSMMIYITNNITLYICFTQNILFCCVKCVAVGNYFVHVFINSAFFNPALYTTITNPKYPITNYTIKLVNLCYYIRG